MSGLGVSKGGSRGAGRERDAGERGSPEVTPGSEVASNVFADSIANPTPSIDGVLGQRTFENHAALLSHPGMAGAPGASQARAGLARQFQRTHGNAYVQRLIDHASDSKPGTGGSVNSSGGEASDVSVRRAAESSVVQRDFAKIEGDTSIGLDTEEAAGGHTIERHVGKEQEYLTGRITAQGIDVASSYPDKSTAESAVTANLQANKSDINSWIFDPSAAPNTNKAVRNTGSGDIGGYLDEHNVQDKKGRMRKQKALKKTKKNVAVVRKKPGGGAFLLTSFPEP